MTSHSRFVSSAHTQRPALAASTLGLATLGLALGCVTGTAPALAQTATTGSTAQQLPAISVEGAATGNAYKVDKSASVKRTETILDTPQSITVVPEKVIQEQGATTLRDVLRNVPGITFGAGEGGGGQGEQLRIRGFSANTDLYVDGIRDPAPQNNRDPFNLEQVEVVKGASSAYSGRGATGGTVNMVTKAPKMQAITAGSLTVGSASTKRVTADINRPLTGVGIDGTAVRLNVMAHESGVPGRDDAVENERWGVAPSIAFGLGTPTRVTLSASYVKQNNTPDYGLPVLSGVIPPVDTKNWYGVKNRDQERQETSSVTATIEHDANDWITLREQARYTESTRFNIVTIPRFPNGTTSFTPATTVTRGATGRDTKDTAFVSQTDATLKFTTGVLSHSLVTGFDISHEKYTQRGLTFSGTTAAANLFSPDTNVAGPGWTSNATQTENTGQDVGVYAIDTVKIGEHWEVVGGVRYDHFKADTDTGTATYSLSDSMVSWQGAVVYKPIKTVSVYASASTSFNPSVEAAQSSLSTTNFNLKPQENLSYEVGAKWDVIPDRLQLTAAVFRTEKTNVRETDASGATVILDGERRVQGFEFSAVGNITDKWQVIGGYSYQDSEITKAVRYVGNEMANTPKHSANLWSTYQLPHDVTVGAGLQYVGKRQINDANTGTLDSYILVDAMVSYQLTDSIGLQLNGQNIFDEKYFDRAHAGGSHVIPGQGRTILLSTNLRF